MARTKHGFAERLIGSIRRECVDHVIVLGEMHLRQALKSYAVLAATGYNFRRLIRWLRLLWRQILAALLPRAFDQSGPRQRLLTSYGRLIHTRSSAAFITTTFEFWFRYTQPS